MHGEYRLVTQVIAVSTRSTTVAMKFIAGGYARNYMSTEGYQSSMATIIPAMIVSNDEAAPRRAEAAFRIAASSPMVSPRIRRGRSFSSSAIGARLSWGHRNKVNRK